jgi:hypothetical protein
VPTYDVLAGTPPNPGTLAFETWCNNLLAAREAQIPAPTATYYFAADGNDTTGDGTEANPWQSLAKANEMLAIDGVCCLFRRGDEWAASTTDGTGSGGALVLAGNNVSVGDYADTAAGHGSDAPLPLIDAFTHTIAMGEPGWTPAGGSQYTYQLIAPQDSGDTSIIPGWIRNEARRLDAYSWMGTATAEVASSGQAAAIATAIAAVGATPYSWFYDPTTGLLHVNTGGVNPSTIDWEWSDQTSAAQQGCIVEQSACVFDLRFDGFGATTAGDTGGSANADACYGIQFRNGSDASANCLIEDCEVYYSGRHCIGQAWNVEYGGSLTVVGCTVGYTSNTGDEGTSLLVAYVPLGGQEFIGWDNTLEFGDLPWSQEAPTGGFSQSLSGSVCDAFGAHTDGGAGHTIGMVLLWGTQVTADQQWANATWCDGAVLSYSGSVNDGGSIAGVRMWDVGRVVDFPTCSAATGYSEYGLGPRPYWADINCYTTYSIPAGNVGPIRPWLAQGYSINETVEIVDPDGTGGRIIEDDGLMVNGFFQITAPAGQIVYINGTGEMIDSVISVVGGATGAVGYFPVGNRSNNAWFGFSSSQIGAEAGAVLLEAPPQSGGAIGPGSPLYEAGCSAATLIGNALEYDANWQPRPAGTPTIGPLEGAASPAYSGTQLMAAVATAQASGAASIALPPADAQPAQDPDCAIDTPVLARVADETVDVPRHWTRVWHDQESRLLWEDMAVDMEDVDVLELARLSS